MWFIYPTSGVKNRNNSFRILSARFILVKGEGKIRDARGSEITKERVGLYFIFQILCHPLFGTALNLHK